MHNVHLTKFRFSGNMAFCFALMLTFVLISPSTEQNVSTDRFLIVAGKKLVLPLKISLISDVVCKPESTSWCPYNLMAPGPGAYTVGVLPSLQRAINRDPDLWPFHNMTIAILNTRSSRHLRYNYTLSLIATNDTLAILGLEGQCDLEAGEAGKSNKLLISHDCSTPNEYPTFVQMRGQIVTIADAVVSYLEENEWDRVVIVYFRFGTKMDPLYSRLKDLLLTNGVKLVNEYVVETALAGIYEHKRFTPQLDADCIFAKLLTETFLFTRVYLVLAFTKNGAEVTFLLDTMARMGLLQTGEYSVIPIFNPLLSAATYNATTQSSQYFLTQPTPIGPLRLPLVEDFYQSYRSASIFTETTAQESARDYPNLYSETQSLPILNPPCPPFCDLMLMTDPTAVMPTSATRLYDTFMIYVRLMSAIIKENKSDITDGYAMKREFVNLRVKETISGIAMELDSQGRASENVTLSTATYLPDGRPGIYGVGTFQSTQDKKLRLNLFDKASFNWPYNKRPPPHPKCGFDNELCPKKVEPKYWIIGIFACLTLALLIGVSAFYWRSGPELFEILRMNQAEREIRPLYLYFVCCLYRAVRRRQHEMQLRRSLWKIMLQDLILNDINQQYNGSMPSVGSASVMGSTATLRLRKMQKSSEEDQNNLIGDHSKKEQEKEIRTTKRKKLQKRLHDESQDDQWKRFEAFGTALYKGRLVALKRVHKKHGKLSRAIREELILITSLTHNNINKLLGVVHDSSAILLVSEYCQKGSLKDILENEEIKMDRIFRASIIFDIINGVQYLQHHTPLHCHGRLKSSNCLVDARWILRLSEFGLFQFREGEEPLCSEDEKCGKLLWTAPEIMRNNFDKRQGSAYGDTYAFGIILHEIFGRRGPFGDEFLDPISAIQKLKFPKADEPLLRPDMRSVFEAPDYARDVMQSCWAEDPFTRPTFSEIKKKLQPLQEGLSSNMLDNIMLMIEKYNDNLEGLVDERTRELEVEKQKADALLSAMLPKPVAEALKQGTTVEPERFEAVTIYFSDIVGFAEIISQCTPYQVINFLHHIYTTFDAMTAEFDVYKVETIGDSYVVVSGLPVRNGDNHAGEIASMALRFMKAAKERKIHQPNGDMAQLRVGIHSGPCVAGVVGLKMPRYCLFGDTVNTASRLESNGQAMKIQCSGQCKRNLDLIGGYETIERGYVAMKGKGEQLTYWLLSEDPKHREERLKDKRVR